MQGIIYFILIIIISVIVIWIIDAINSANKAAERLPALMKKVEEKAARMSNQELIFNQFSNYVLKMFEMNDRISKSDLLANLKRDFPGYKNDYLELFYDLKYAELIEDIKWEDKYFELGESFRNIKLMHPKLLQFMKRKCNNFEYRMNHIDDWEIFEVDIKSTKKISDPDLYFSFGVCFGSDISKKILIDKNSINIKSFYLYGKLHKYYVRNNPIEGIVSQHYCELNEKINFEMLFNDWLMKCKSIND